MHCHTSHQDTSHQDTSQAPESVRSQAKPWPFVIGLVALGVAGALALGVQPGTLLAIGFVLICPLMMFGMHGGHGHAGHESRTSSARRND